MNPTTQLLERIAALIHQTVREDAARHDLLPIHLQVLAYLARANLYSDIPIAVAEYFGISRGSVSQTIAVLERKGLIERHSDSRNRKHVHLVLTARGRTVLEASWSQRLDQVLAARSGTEVTALETGLRGLLQALQAENGQQAFGICHRCQHFLKESRGYRCGLTGDPLEAEQTNRLCREWSTPIAS
jgi:MarR family transcriptional regulator, negative regulator of the multidrug operon emrRAB